MENFHNGGNSGHTRGGYLGRGQKMCFPPSPFSPLSIDMYTPDSILRVDICPNLLQIHDTFLGRNHIYIHDLLYVIKLMGGGAKFQDSSWGLL